MNKIIRTDDWCNSVVEYFPNMHKDVGSILNIMWGRSHTVILIQTTFVNLSVILTCCLTQTALITIGFYKHHWHLILKYTDDLKIWRTYKEKNKAYESKAFKLIILALEFLKNVKQWFMFNILSRKATFVHVPAYKISHLEFNALRSKNIDDEYKAISAG